jgi:hypothetical protein
MTDNTAADGGHHGIRDWSKACSADMLTILDRATGAP